MNRLANEHALVGSEAHTDESVTKVAAYIPLDNRPKFPIIRVSHAERQAGGCGNGLWVFLGAALLFMGGFLIAHECGYAKVPNKGVELQTPFPELLKEEKAVAAEVQVENKPSKESLKAESAPKKVVESAWNRLFDRNPEGYKIVQIVDPKTPHLGPLQEKWSKHMWRGFTAQAGWLNRRYMSWKDEHSYDESRGRYAGEHVSPIRDFKKWFRFNYFRQSGKSDEECTMYIIRRADYEARQGPGEIYGAILCLNSLGANSKESGAQHTELPVCFVREELKGSGWREKLVDEAISHAKVRHGGLDVFVHCTHEDKRFFERVGFSDNQAHRNGGIPKRGIYEMRMKTSCVTRSRSLRSNTQSRLAAGQPPKE